MTYTVREAAQKAIDAMHEFWKVAPQKNAVQWLEDSQGRILIFTRGEYRDDIMRVIAGKGPLSDVQFFVDESESGE
jgi:hypothetical protein